MDTAAILAREIQPKIAGGIHDFDLLVFALKNQRHTSTVEVAAFAWLAYDILLTFADELRIVWRWPITLPKVLYCIARYNALVALCLMLTVSTATGGIVLNDTICQNWFRYYFIACLISPYAVNCMLLVRIYALYNRNKKLLIALSILVLAGFISALVLVIKMLPRLRSVARPPGLGLKLQGCLVYQKFEYLETLVPWSLSLLIQVVFFSLTMYQYVLSARAFGGYGEHDMSLRQSVRKTREFAPIVSLFFRDGTVYFLWTLGAVLVNMLFVCGFVSGRPSMQGSPWLLAAEAIAASRLFLGLSGYLSRSIGGVDTELTDNYDNMDLDIPASGSGGVPRDSDSTGCTAGRRSGGRRPRMCAPFRRRFCGRFPFERPERLRQRLLATLHWQFPLPRTVLLLLANL